MMQVELQILVNLYLAIKDSQKTGRNPAKRTTGLPTLSSPDLLNAIVWVPRDELIAWFSRGLAGCSVRFPTAAV
jgi:hypothetical protein